MALRIAFGLLDTSAEADDPAVSIKARSLTVSWIRWCYQGEILEDRAVDEILRRAAERDYDYCLVQSYGHIIMEQSGPVGRRPPDFLERLQAWLSAEDLFVAGRILRCADRGYGLTTRCLLVNVRQYRRFGYPAFGAGPPMDSEPCMTVSRIEPSMATSASAFELPGGGFIAAALHHNATVSAFPPELATFLIDLGSDLTREPGTLDAIRRQAERARSGVFVLNFEGYEDIEIAPPAFRPPVSVLYSVAAGLKPNRILETHGFDPGTRLVYFDYSQQALEFRRAMVEGWDGRDLPGFLRGRLGRSPEAHYYLGPGASPEALERSEMDRLWQLELSRWGGEDEFLRHWDRYRTLDHEYLLCNIFSDQERLLGEIEDSDSSVIWWSNVFCTSYSGWHYNLDDKRHVYEAWIDRIGLKAPRLLLYGSDHGNSSVNCIAAGNYRERYFAGDGDPLSGRQLFQYALRF